MRRAIAIELSDEERRTLTQWERGRRTEVRLVTRAKIVLMAAAGMENQEIAVILGIARGTVATWRNRFAQERLAGIVKDRPRGGRRPAERELRGPALELVAELQKGMDGRVSLELGGGQRRVRRSVGAGGLRHLRPRSQVAGHDGDALASAVRRLIDHGLLHRELQQQALDARCPARAQSGHGRAHQFGLISLHIKAA